MSRVLNALLEGFDEGRHPRGYHGRWVTPGRVMDVFHGDQRIGSVAKTKEPPFPEYTPSVPGGRALRTRADMTYGVAAVISHHQGTRDAFPFAEHVAAARGVVKDAPSPGRFGKGDHVIYQHGMFGKVPAQVTKVTASRVHITSSDPRVSDTSMTHNQAAVRLENMTGPHAPRVKLKRGQTANELKGGIPRAQEALTVGVLVEAFAPPTPSETPAQSMAIGAQQQAAAKASLRAGWTAAKHPRGAGGKFGYTTGGKRAKKGTARKPVRQGNTLTVGTRGALVKSIQAQLGIPSDGVYGQATRAAVLKFQAQHGLAQDGVVGAQTLAALRGNPRAASIAPGPIATKQARVIAPKSKAKAPVQPAGQVPPGRFAGGTVI